MQQVVTDQPAFILQRKEFQNSSLILDLLTAQYGRVRVVAKGARKRRDAAHFQPFNRLLVGWRGRNELKTLTHIESRPIPVPNDCYLAAFYVTELLLYLLPGQEEQGEIFTAYEEILQSLEHAYMEPQLRCFEIQLLTALGLMPDLLHQSESGQQVIDDGFYWLDVQTGIVAGDPHDPNSFRGDRLKAVKLQDFSCADNLRTARRVLRQIIDFNLQGRTLQSRKLYQQLHKAQKNE